MAFADYTRWMKLENNQWAASIEAAQIVFGVISFVG